jgi:2,3-bisphosphoglycerate-independent phosphoglycerate mutase
MKYLILVCDGMADLKSKEHNNQTPLEFANTPNFDLLANNGINGIMQPVKKGTYPGSDVSHLSLLGYDPEKYYPNRGPLEALGAGINLEEGDLALRTNFGTVDENLIVKDRRAGRIKEGLEELEEALNSIELPVEYTFHHTIDHRGALVLKNCSGKVSDSDPHKVGEKVLEFKPLDGSEETAKILTEYSEKAHKILSELPLNKKRSEEGKLPANYLLMRGAGTFQKVPSFKERYNLSGACIAEVALVKGVGKYLDMEVIEVPGSTGNEFTPIDKIFEHAISALEKHDFVLVNVKGADNFGHDGNFEGKANMIEKIDSHLEILIENCKDKVLVITADHATPVSHKDHSEDIVPLCINGPGVEADEVQKLGENFCSTGKLGKVAGLDLMEILIKLNI